LPFLATWYRDFKHVSKMNRLVRFPPVPVEKNLSAFAGTLSLCAGLKDACDIEPEIKTQYVTSHEDTRLEPRGGTFTFSRCGRGLV
jgi:hypothetical protein